MPLSYPPIRPVTVDGEKRWTATCRTCGQDVVRAPQLAKVAVDEQRRAHGYEADCKRAEQTSLCGWFALCTRPAAGTTAHPVLGNVPVCQECATRFDLEVTP